MINKDDVFYIILAGICNGFFLFPPSEYIYIYLFDKHMYGFSVYLFCISNIIGHTILFIVSKFIHKSLIRFSFFKNYVDKVNIIICKLNISSSYIIIGRLLPVLHSFVSFVAAQNREKFGFFIRSTIFGNVVFLHINYIIFLLTERYGFGLFEKLVTITFIVALVHYLVNKLTFLSEVNNK